MIFCLLGKSAAGKDSILSEIIKKGIIDGIVSDTTRPARSNETYGVNYYFLTKEEFLNKMTNGDYLETTKYDVAVNNDTWYYGVDGTKLNMNKNYLTIVNPDGYRQIKAKLGSENVIGILIAADDKERLIRSLMRDNNVNCLEVCRRFVADNQDFKNIENEVKYIVKNRDLKQSIKIVEKIIEKEISTHNQQPEIPYSSKVKVVKIMDTDEAGHLVKTIGAEGYVVGKINYKGVDRYKVLLDISAEVTAYYRRGELEVVL